MATTRSIPPEASTPPVDAQKVILELEGISKFFGGVRALNNVNLTLRAAEIVALVGDNGAGKSTLVKLLSGTGRPDAGVMRFEGQPVVLHGPTDATALGIQTVYQDLALCDNLDMVQNLFLGREVTSSKIPGSRLRRPTMEHQAREVLAGLGANIRNLRTPVGRLSGGQRQAIAVCRSELSNPKLVLLDEPTAALGVAQREQVLNLIKRLKAQGRSVVVISHDLHDVRDVADRVVVLRLGEKVAEMERGKYTPEQLVGAITGASHAAAEDIA
jgi:D-xylose transport system ATP-binding protein